MKYFLHPLTQVNFLICGTLAIIQIVHTTAHYKMDMDVHAYCRNNAEGNKYIEEEEPWQSESTLTEEI
tara:strand:+ start:258 stop:461 length:204 start_codon:yes stop_codon:yes gene_type:complete